MAAQTQGDDLEAKIDAALDIVGKADPATQERMIADLDTAVSDVRYTEVARAIIAHAVQLQQKAATQERPQPKDAPRPVAQPIPRRAKPGANAAARRIFGLTALVFGLPLWAVGAHYTLDGWTFILNTVLDLLRTGVVLPLASGMGALLLVPIGIMYSIGERRYIPFGKADKRWVFLGWGVLLVWGIVNGTDLASTYLGIASPLPDAWPLTKWMAATLWAKIAWIVVVTYLPEVLVVFGWRWLASK
jgi:hypothetical protein